MDKYSTSRAVLRKPIRFAGSGPRGRGTVAVGCSTIHLNNWPDNSAVNKSTNHSSRLIEATHRWVLSERRPRGRRQVRGHLRLVDLFCGCGGMTLGAWEACRTAGLHLDIRLAVDFAAKPLRVYQKNFECPDGAALCRDLSMLLRRPGCRISRDEGELRSNVGDVDLLVAGPPCQGHSDLNNSSRRSDPRNQLYLAVVRAAELLQPRMMIVENVPTVIHDSSRVVHRSMEALQRLGYHTASATICMTDLGLPQLRRRHVLVVTVGRLFDVTALPKIEKPPATVGLYFGGLEDEPTSLTGKFYQPCVPTTENRARIDFLHDNDIYELPDSKRPPCHSKGSHAYLSMYGRMRWDRPAQTLTSGFGSMGQGRYVHPTRRRLITPHEAARLQGFPDFFDFRSEDSITALREMIANAVPPQVVATIATLARRQSLL